MSANTLADTVVWIPALLEDGTHAYEPRTAASMGEHLRRRSILAPLTALTPQRPPPRPWLRWGERVWRLVLPAETSSGPSARDIQQALDPLLRHRNAPEPLFYEPQENGSPEDQAAAFEEQYAEIFSKETVSLMLAGPLADLPWTLQHTLGARHATGRLDLPSLDAYAAYAQKILEAEEAPPTDEISEALLFAPRQDQATEISHDALVSPLQTVLPRKKQSLKITSLLSEQAQRSALMAELERLSSRGLWVFGGHGCQPRKWTSQQLGMLFDQKEVGFHADQVPGMTRCLERGIAIFLTCYGAGRRNPRETEALLGDAPANVQGPELLAPLPTALLTHPKGPLAVLGHVNSVHLMGYGNRAFQIPKDGAQPGVMPVQGLLEKLVQGEPLGTALTTHRMQISRRQDAVESVLRAQRGQEPPKPEQNAALVLSWLAYHDARTWVVLGDPDVKLMGGLE